MELKGCFSNAGSGIENPPEELFATGLSRYDFDTMMEKLAAIRAKRSTCCCDVFWIVAMVLSLFSLICYICRGFAKETYALDKELRAWQKEFNEKYLEKRGMYVKTQATQSIQYVVGTNNGELARGGAGFGVINPGVIADPSSITAVHYREEEYFDRYLCFAMNPEEVELLKKEPHIVCPPGKEPDDGCCGGPDNRELCVPV